MGGWVARNCAVRIESVYVLLFSVAAVGRRRRVGLLLMACVAFSRSDDAYRGPKTVSQAVVFFFF